MSNYNIFKVRELSSKKKEWDKSIKEFEIIALRYTFVNSSKTLDCQPYWEHVKYYSTLTAAEDAIKAYRGHSPWIVHTNPNYKYLIFSRYKIRKRILN